jgi:hypothetical protein
MFNFFKKSPEKKEIFEKEEKDNLSSVKFTINKEAEIYVDINLADYDKESISNFAALLSNLSSFRFHMEVLEIVKNGFEDNKKLELFDYLLSEIITYTQDDTENLEKILKDQEEGDSEEPCIKPSDML